MARSKAIAQGTPASDDAPTPASGTSLTLYDITAEQRALDAMVTMDEGEWTDETEALFQDLVSKMVEKADNFGRYVRTRESIVAAIKDEEKRLADRRKAIENHVDRLKSYAVMCMRLMQRDKIEGTTFTLAVQKNNVTAIIEAEAEELLEAFQKYHPATFSVDRAAVLAALKAGVEVPGCALAEPSYHLRIR
jgi:uncharacterized protein YqgV (UPF0045/DUF77 family)